MWESKFSSEAIRGSRVSRYPLSAFALRAALALILAQGSDFGSLLLFMCPQFLECSELKNMLVIIYPGLVKESSAPHCQMQSLYLKFYFLCNMRAVRRQRFASLSCSVAFCKLPVLLLLFFLFGFRFLLLISGFIAEIRNKVGIFPALQL